jgi:hypothetical protein
MPITPYNSILDDNWYTRLRQGVVEGANAGIRATRSDPNDPFWKAKQAQGLGDLSSARTQAEQYRYSQGAAQTANNNVAARARDKYRQQVISAALRRKAAANVDDNTFAGSFDGEDQAMPTPQMPEAPQAAPQTPYIAPPAYVPAPVKMQQSSGYGGALKPPATPSVYNPAQFGNPVLDKRKKKLEDFYSQMAKVWR